MDAPAARSPQRILALDVGSKRVGLAVTDELGLMAHGLPTLIRTKTRQDLARLAEIAHERNVGLLIVGLPLHMSGTDSPRARATRDFAAKLEARAGLPVQLWDERLTSVEAESVFRDRGTRPDRSAGDVDRIAAIVLLEDYLASHPGPVRVHSEE